MNPKLIMGRDPRARPASALGNPLLAEPKKLIQELSPRAIDADLEALTHEIQKLRKRCGRYDQEMRRLIDENNALNEENMILKKANLKLTNRVQRQVALPKRPRPRPS